MSLLKYGACDNKMDWLLTGAGAFWASQKLPAAGGRFVYWDISDAYWKSCTDNQQAAGGWVKQALTTTSATNGGTIFPIMDIRDRIFELPYASGGAAATLTETVGKALLQKKIDLYVTSGVQYADNATDQALFIVRGYNVPRNTLKVMVDPVYILQVA